MADSSGTTKRLDEDKFKYSQVTLILVGIGFQKQDEDRFEVHEGLTMAAMGRQLKTMLKAFQSFKL
jgi:hypothetical protein